MRQNAYLDRQDIHIALENMKEELREKWKEIEELKKAKQAPPQVEKQMKEVKEEVKVNPEPENQPIHQAKPIPKRKNVV